MEASTARQHAASWIDAWNRHDLDAILAHYTPDVDFVTPTVTRRWGRPDGRLRGVAELRQHFARGLALAPDLHFTLEDVLIGTDGYTVLYCRENGNRAADVVICDSSGQAAIVRAYYVAEQP